MSTLGRISSSSASSVVESSSASSVVERSVVYEFSELVAGTVRSSSIGRRPRLRGILGVSDPLEAWKLVGSTQEPGNYTVVAQSRSTPDAVYTAGLVEGADILQVTDVDGNTGLITFHVGDEEESGFYLPGFGPAAGTSATERIETGARFTFQVHRTWSNLWSVQGWSDALQNRGTITQPWDSSVPNIYTAPSVPCVELVSKFRDSVIYRVFMFIRDVGALGAYCIPFCAAGTTRNIAAVGGTGPFTWEIIAGTGTLTPQGDGSYATLSDTLADSDYVHLVKVRVTDSLGASYTVTMFATAIPWQDCDVSAAQSEVGMIASLGDPTPVYTQELELVSSSSGSTLEVDPASTAGTQILHYTASKVAGGRDHLRWTDSNLVTTDLYLLVTQGERTQWINGTEKETLVAKGAQVYLYTRGGSWESGQYQGMDLVQFAWTAIQNESGSTLELPAWRQWPHTRGRGTLPTVRLLDSTGNMVDLSGWTGTCSMRGADGRLKFDSYPVGHIDTLTIRLPIWHPGTADLWAAHCTLEFTITNGVDTVSGELLFESPTQEAYEAAR